MKTLLYAKNIHELLFQIQNNPGIQVVGGCTRQKVIKGCAEGIG